MNGLGICKPIKEKLEQVVEEGKLETVHLANNLAATVGRHRPHTLPISNGLPK